MATTTSLLVTKIEASQSQKEVTANLAFDIFDKAIAGGLSKAITTADVTLTDDEGRNAFITLTGALTGNRALIVPTRTKIYIINNTTTGAFTATVKTSAGTGVVVLQGTRQVVYCDGTNVVQLGGQGTRTDTPTTNAIVNSLTISNNSTGTPAAGLGTGILFQGETSTTQDTDMGRLALSFSDVTHASRTTFAALGTVSNAGAIVDRVMTGMKKALTDAATNLFEVALPTLTGFSCAVTYEIFATNGTDVQVRHGIVILAAVNKAGVYSTSVILPAANEGIAFSAGTLTATFAITGGTNKVTISVTPTGSLTETTYYITYTIQNNSEQAITIL